MVLASTENRYFYPDPSEGWSRKEHEKQMLSWNKEVYEARVAKAFVEEKLLRHLYQQQVQARSRGIYQQHHEVVMRNQIHGDRLSTPYRRKKRLHQQTEAALAQAMEAASPRFHDIEALTPRLDREALSRRGLPAHASGIAQPASMRELSNSVQLPPLYTLMNPRNQMTSPLPEKESLLPPSPRARREAEKAKMRPMGLGGLLRFISLCFDEKRSLENVIYRKERPPLGQPCTLIPIGKIISQALSREHGSSEVCAEKLALLRLSCKSDVGHGSHPRVALFRYMAGLEETPSKVDPKQEYVCTQLLSWLNIATSKPPAKDQRMLLLMKDVNMLVESLYRQRLVPNRAQIFLKNLALEVREPVPDGPGSPFARRGSVTDAMSMNPNPAGSGRRDSSSGRRGSLNAELFAVDAEELVLCWMQRWGEWDDFTTGMPEPATPAEPIVPRAEDSS
jgi:hypothetical protein